MKRSEAARVLMLGWEYPPRFVGGLGKASQGIARGLADLGLDVLFVLPRFRPRRDGKRLRVSGAREWLLAHGSQPRASGDGPHFIGIDARLRPYARPHAPVERARGLSDPNVDRANAVYGSDLGREIARFREHVLTISDEADADLLHAHDWVTFPAAVATARRHHLPLFLHLHSTEVDRSGDGANPGIFDIEREACEAATHVFAVSDYTRGILISRYGIDPAKVSVVYNAPDGPIRPIAEPSPEKREPWVVFLGRLTFQKGPDHFVEAAALAAPHNPRMRFLICGSGDMRDRLRAQAQALGIGDRVEFRGFLTPGAVNKLLARSSLLVMPSVSEPFGLVALEALRVGTPVILSRQSGVREVLGHSLQVDFWDHEKLADQMLAVMRLPVLAEQLVDEGRAQLSLLSWDVSAQRIVQAYARAGIHVASDWAADDIAEAALDA